MTFSFQGYELAIRKEEGCFYYPGKLNIPTALIIAIKKDRLLRYFHDRGRGKEIHHLNPYPLKHFQHLLKLLCFFTVS